MARNIVVLGSDGFIGKNLCESLASFTPLDKTLGYDLATADGQAKLEECLISLASKDNQIDVVMAAANVGAKLFNEHPIDPFFENFKIDTMTIETMKKVASASNAEFHVSYCSTSEVYPSLENPVFIPYPRTVSIDPKNGRSLYAQEKLMAETLLNYELGYSSWLKSLRIFRLFNVSGKHQRRGVIYEMVKSAMSNYEIHFAEKASREITFVADAVNEMLSRIISRDSGTWDITSKKHILLSDLAICIKDALSTIDNGFKCIKTISDSCDSFMPNRGTVPIMRTSHEIEEFKCELVESGTFNDIVEDILHAS